MSLLSPLALLFGLVAAVPLVLHLYQQRKRTVMMFSSNRFFTESVVRSQRRLRLRRWFLLLLRMAACLLLAMALAQPILSFFGAGTLAKGSRDMVILLDDSLSMTAQAPHQPTTRFHRAKRLAIETLGELQAGDRAAVVTFTGRTIGRSVHAASELTGDTTSLRQKLDAMEPTLAAGDAHHALRIAAELFEGAEQRARLLMVFTDGQAADWRNADWPQPDHPVAATVATVGQPTTSNIVADQASLSSASTIVGQPNLLRARLVNFQPHTVAATVVLTVDGKELVRRPVELTGQSPRTESMPLTFDTPGEHRWKLELTGEDDLPADNTLYGVARVSRRLPVLIVAGPPSGDGRWSSARYLAAALLAVGSEEQSIQPDTVAPADLSGVRLDGYRAIVLANVPALEAAPTGRLEEYVNAGGGLCVLLGDRIDRSYYNLVLGDETRPRGGLMPCQVRSIVSTDASAQPMHILQAQTDHPILQRFSGALRSALGSVSIYRAHGVVARDAWTVATMDKGLPLIVERRYGRGKVIVFAADFDPTWTNLPLRRAFIPLANRTIGYLTAGGLRPRPWQVGRELALRRGGWDYEKPLQAIKPDGTMTQAAVRLVGAEPVAHLPAHRVDQAGFYQVQLPPDSPAADSDAQPIHFAVNAPRPESLPETLDLDALADAAGRWQLNTVDLSATGAESIAAMLGEGEVSRGIWDILLWIVLVVILVEPLIANRRIGPLREPAVVRGRQAA